MANMIMKDKFYNICIALISLISINGIGCGTLNAQTHNLASDAMKDKMNKVYTATVNQKEYTFKLKDNCLYSLGEIKDGGQAEGEVSSLLLENVLDIKFYNLDFEGNDELIVLTLAPNEEEEEVFREGHSQYGEKLQLYDLSLEKERPKVTLKYTNYMKSIHPWKIDAGKIDDKDIYANIFVGVYKDTRFYKEVINRPFFLTWNGEFIERKWTGSYLATNEYVDLIFVDFIGDGYDEVAVLERKEDCTYQVSLYKWLTFGFEYLMSSTECYEDAIGIISSKTEGEKGTPTIWVQCKDGCKIVKFK